LLELVDIDGFWIRRASAGIDVVFVVVSLGSGDGGPANFAFPPIASYRSTISDIEVRRIARDFDPSGGTKPGEGIDELSTDFEGKINID
jgi:hypothetical protein